MNSKKNANVCSDPVQSHYDEKFIHDNRSTSQNEIQSFKLYSLVQSGTVWYSLYTFLHTPPVSKTANVKTWLTFIQSNIANLICVSFAVQYILFRRHRSLVVMFLAGAAKTSALHIVSGEIHPQLKASKSMLHNGVRADLICRINLLIIIALDTSQQYNVHLQTRLYRTQKCALDRDILRCKTFK